MVLFNIFSIFRQPVITVTSFDRPNLYLEAKLKSKTVLEDILPLMVREPLGKYSPEGPTIIYCPTKKITEEVVSELRGKFPNDSITSFQQNLFFIFANTLSLLFPVLYFVPCCVVTTISLPYSLLLNEFQVVCI